ncbi:MAG: hypothetical protein ACJ8HI_23660 [Massilia sp.]
MKRLRFYLNVKQTLQLQCANVLLLTSSQWHSNHCGPLWRELPLLALMGFAAWRMATGFYLAPRAAAASAPAPAQATLLMAPA